MKIIYYGHSCFQVDTGETSIIIDPFLSGNPNSGMKPEDVKVGYILLTHGHGDHVGDTIAIAKNNDATVIATYELASYLERKGVKVHAMSLGGGYQFPFGRVKLTQAFHGSAIDVEEDGQLIYAGMPAGILLTIGDTTIYHAGDTGLFGDMKLIGEMNRIHTAMLPIGDNFTMGPDDALIAAEWLKAENVIPMHYDTFPLIAQDGDAFVGQLKQKGINGTALKPGESFNLEI